MNLRHAEFQGLVERKSPELPRFVVVGQDEIASWHLTRTTVVDVRLGGVDIGRRTLKYWGRDRDCWFFDVTQGQCAAAGVNTGDSVRVEMSPAATDLPEELVSLIDSGGAASEMWSSLTASRRRQIAEHVRSAKKPETRRRRARGALLDGE